MANRTPCRILESGQRRVRHCVRRWVSCSDTCNRTRTRRRQRARYPHLLNNGCIVRRRDSSYLRLGPAGGMRATIGDSHMCRCRHDRSVMCSQRVSTCPCPSLPTTDPPKNQRQPRYPRGAMLSSLSPRVSYRPVQDNLIKRSQIRPSLRPA